MSRVHQLIDHCTDTVEIVNPDTGIAHERDFFDKERFAELIVKEMLKTCEEHPGWTGRMIGEEIKKHFGVEEPKGWVCPKCNADRTKIACPLGFGATVDGRCPMTVEAQ